MKRALVCGAGGFIGSHLVNRVKREGFWVRGVDLKYPEFSETSADDFIQGDLRDAHIAREAIDVRGSRFYCDGCGGQFPQPAWIGPMAREDLRDDRALRRAAAPVGDEVGHRLLADLRRGGQRDPALAVDDPALGVGARKVAEQYSWDRIARRLVEIYEQLTVGVEPERAAA